MTTAPSTSAQNAIMKTTVTASCRIGRATLLASLAEAKGYVASKHSILSSVRLTFNGGPGGTTTLGILTTDSLRWYTDVLYPDSTGTGDDSALSVICDAKKLHDIVKAMDDEHITLKGTLTKNVSEIPGSKVGPKVEHASLVQVMNATGEYSVKGGDSTRFPGPPTPPSLWATYDARALSLALVTAKPFISKDAARVHLTAALVEVAPDQIRAVASDGHRLAKIVRAAQHAVATPSRFLIPLAAIGDVLDRCKTLLPRKGAATVNAGIDIGLRGNAVFWKGEGARCYATFHEVGAENFPPYNQVIPRTFDRGVTIDRVLLLATAKRLLNVASKTTGCVLHLPASSTTPHILLIETDDGESQAKEKLPIQLATFASTPLAIGVNLTYLIEALDSYTSKTVYLSFNGNLDPIGVKQNAMDEDIVVIMPMRM